MSKSSRDITDMEIIELLSEEEEEEYAEPAEEVDEFEDELEQLDDDDQLSQKPKIGRPRKKKKKGAKGTSGVTRDNNDQQTGYTFMYKKQECHGQKIYGCRFLHYSSTSSNDDKSDRPTVFAVVGNRVVSLYECHQNGEFSLRARYADPTEDEDYYCCDWSEDSQKSDYIYLAVAGLHGVIKILNIELDNNKIRWHNTIVGHGAAVNDLVFHPIEKSLLVSASKDHSLRFHNIRTDCLIATFVGHRDEIVTVDINHRGTLIASAGIDHSINIWRIDDEKIMNAISHSFTRRNWSKTAFSFPTVLQTVADFSTRAMHSNYIDCVKWFDDSILSKSCDGQVGWWTPVNKATRYTSSEIKTYNEFEIPDCTIWFMKFTLNKANGTLAVGNHYGQLFIFEISSSVADLTNPDPSTTPVVSTRLIDPRAKCTKPIREVTFSQDGRILICVSDEGAIWRWDLIKREL